MSKFGHEKIDRIDNPEKYKVAIYIRTGAKVEGLDAVKFQKDRVEEYCEDLKVKIKEEYIDDGYSTFSENRPAYNKLLEDLKNGKIDMVITANMSRLSRSQKEMLDILKLQKEYGFRTLLADSREELDGDRCGINLNNYIKEVLNGDAEIEDNTEDEEMGEDMDF